METALLVLAALACPLGMLAMMGGMAWMAQRTGSEKGRSHRGREMSGAR